MKNECLPKEGYKEINLTQYLGSGWSVDSISCIKSGHCVTIVFNNAVSSINSNANGLIQYFPAEIAPFTVLQEMGKDATDNIPVTILLTPNSMQIAGDISFSKWNLQNHKYCGTLTYITKN